MGESMDRGREGAKYNRSCVIIMDGYSRYSKYSKIYSSTDTAKYELKNLGCGYLGIQCTNNSCNFSVTEILHDKVLGKESKEWK